MIWLVLLFVLSAWPVQATVLLSESSFETTVAADGWAYPGAGASYCSASPCPYLDVSTDFAHSGSKSLKGTWNKAWSDPNPQINTTSLSKNFPAGTWRDVYWRYWYRTRGFNYNTPNSKKWIVLNASVTGSNDPRFFTANQNSSRIQSYTNEYQTDGGPTPHRYDSNMTSIPLLNDQWYCIVDHIKYNTPGVADGVLEQWINGNQTIGYYNQLFQSASHNGKHTGLQFYKQNGWGTLTRAEAGFTGGPATDYGLQYVDQVIAATTRAEVDNCSGPPIDTIPPGVPTSLAVAGGTVSWVNASDNTGGSGIGGSNVRRCSGAPCTPTTGVASLGPSVTSWADPNRIVGLAYSYSVNNFDIAGNQGPYGTAVSDSAAASTFRTAPTISDDFNRANNADLGAAWDAGYTSPNHTTATLISNEIRGTAVNASEPKSVETNNSVALPNDQWCSVTLGTFIGTEDREHGCILRAAAPPTVNWYWCYARKTATNAPARNSSIVSHHTNKVGDANLPIATDTTTVWGSGDKLICEAEGTALRLKRIAAGSSVETTILTATDSEFTGGRAGIAMWMNTGGTLSNASITDFQAGGFSSATAATITSDSVSSSATSNTTNTISWTHTVGTGTNKELLIYTSARDTSVDADTVLTGCTVGGSPATIVRQDLNNSIAGVGIRTAISRFDNPNGGANTITCTWAGALSAYGVGSTQSFFGVDQTAPIDANAGGSGTGTSVSTSITTVNDGAMIASVTTGRGNTMTSGGSQTSRVSRSTTGTVDGIGISTLTKSTAGAQAMVYTHDAAQEWAHSVVSLKPATITPIVAPKCATLTADTTGLNVTFGATTPTKLRIDRGSNSGLLYYQTEIVVATDLTNGRYTKAGGWEAGLDFLGCHAIDAAGVENTVSTDYVYISNATNWSGTIDTAEVVMSNAQPSNTLPAGTTSRVYSFNIDKTAACRSSTTDQAYSLMSTQMDVLGGTASATQAGLTDNSITTLYGRCLFTDVLDDVHANSSSIVITITVAAAAGDVTAPSTVTNVVCTPHGACVWTAATDNIALRGYQVSLSTDACATFFFVTNPTATNYTFTQISPNTSYCVVVRAEDTSGNLSSADSNQATFTTPPLTDVIPPSDMANLRECGIFTASVQLCFDPGTDNIASVVTLMERCVGAACVDFTLTEAQTSSSILSTSLTPGTINRFRGKFSDGTNSSLNYSNIIDVTTSMTGLQRPRVPLPFGTSRSSTSRSAAGTRISR